MGDFLLLVDESCPRGRWSKGIIQEVFPDQHGVVRHVTVRTATTSLRRDVLKLYVTCTVKQTFPAQES